MTQCPACGETATRPLFWKADGAETAWPGVKPPGTGGYQIVGCVTCGLGRVDPLPTPEELAALYQRDYFAPPRFVGRASDGLLAYRANPGRTRLDTVRAASEHAYEVAHVRRLGGWYAQLSAASPPTIPLPPSSPTYGGRKGEQRRLRFLDVGSGRGGVLRAARAMGWTAVGVEPSAVAARLAAQQGLTVVPTTLPEAGFPDAVFDIVHLREVLEHVSDPLALLGEARRILRPGGLLYVQVPNDLAGYRRYLFRRVWWLIPPYHLWYFTAASLEQLLARVGLTIQAQGTLGMGVGYDAYRSIGATLGVLPWLDAHEDGPLALVPRLTRAAFRLAGTPADAALNRAQRHSSLWFCACYVEN